MDKKRLLGFTCILGAAMMVSSVSVAADFSEVEVKGNKRIEKETILAYMKFNENSTFDEERMNNALKELFATGLFADVKIYPDGKVLKVEVKENPIVSGVYFDGNSRLENEQLEGSITMGPRSVYTKDRVAKDVRSLLELYRRSGRFAVAIEPKIIERDQNRVDVVYEIDEGPATYVQRISFIGNDNVSDSDLEEAIMTKEDKWYRFLSSTTSYDPDRMAYDKELLRRFYLNNGYIDINVISAIAELTPDREGFFITFNISEGDRYQIGKVELTTSLRNLDVTQLAPMFELEEGEWYSAEKIEDIVQTLSDETIKLGYAFVDVIPNIKKRPKSDDSEDAIVDITFDIREGSKVFIDKIQINGNVRTKDEVIRREFRIAEGDAFNAAKVRRSKQRIENLNYFSKVELQTEPSDVLPDKANINVDVEEKSTGSLTFGVGWSTYDGALVQAGITERNLLGNGQILSLKGSIAQKRTEYDISFTEPYFLGRDLTAGIDLFNFSQDYQSSSSYNEKAIGGALRFGWSFNEKVRESMKYTLRQDDIYDIDPTASIYIQEQAGKTVTSMVSHSISYDVRDSTIRPNDGFVITLSNDLAGLGGDNRFLRTDLYGAYYLPIVDDWTLAFKTHGGYIFGFDEDVRISERYFLGGSNLRGFEQGGAAARAQNGDAIGGNWIATGTVELIFPLGLPSEFGLRGRVFTDIGVAGKPDGTNAKYEIDYSSKPRASVGFGIGWDSPMGLINIDIAYAFMKEDYDETEVFRLNFGTGF